MIFNPNRHEPLNARPWSSEETKQAVHQIFNFLVDGFQPETFWSSHADDESRISCNKTLYFGASGTLWTLHELSSYLNRSLPISLAETIDRIYQSYLKEPDSQAVVPSYLLGESGILLLHRKWTGSDEYLARLAEIISKNIENPTMEALWGAPSTMLVALRLFRETQDERWLDLYRENLDFLWKTWACNDQGFWTWTALYPDPIQYVGPGHGYLGNVFPMFEGFEYLSMTQQEILLQRTLHIVAGTAVVQEGKANWPNTFKGMDERVRVQWCHGAPGVVISLKRFPVKYSDRMEELLVRAGELIWHAGPQNKRIGVCHGTDGNGYAFLRLYKRTGNPLWLERARHFAMHSIQQRNRSYSLWTGEAGLAHYLMSCIEEWDRVPCMDYL